MTQPMRVDLSGKTALVTGASRGIGCAISKTLAKNGAKVIGVATSIELNDNDLSSDIAGFGGSFRAYSCDLSDRAAIDAMIKVLDDEGTAVDILINNAGIIRSRLDGRPRTPGGPHGSSSCWTLAET